MLRHGPRLQCVQQRAACTSVFACAAAWRSCCTSGEERALLCGKVYIPLLVVRGRYGGPLEPHRLLLCCQRLMLRMQVGMLCAPRVPLENLRGPFLREGDGSTGHGTLPPVLPHTRSRSTRSLHACWQEGLTTAQQE
jgi:hypothetical protein